MAEPGWKEALAQGRPLEPHFELSPELVNRMGIHKDDAGLVFSTLTKNRRKTWGHLLDLETKAEAIEVAEDEVNGKRLWRFIEGQKELSKKRVSLTAEPKSAEEVLRDELAGLNWPEHLEAFSPRTLDTESFRNREAAVRVAQAGILGNFLRPTEPDLLLTELTKVREATEFAIHEFEYHIDASDNLSLENPSSIDFKVLDGMGMIVLIGTSGAGKTALTLRRALDRPTILLACTKQATGGMGSSDITELLEKAVSLKNAGDLSIPQLSEYIKNKVKKILYARGRLYAECKRRYPGFTNLHWIMLQLYGSDICGVNWWCPNYFHHPSEATSPADLLSEVRIEEVVLDEAQIADTVLTGTFPSSNRITKRSILSPITQALKTSGLKVTICGTGLSSASVVPAAASPIKLGVRVGVVAVATFLDRRQVKDYLEKSGVSDLDQLDEHALYLFQGRPRHAAYLARDLILSENPSSATAPPESTKDVAAIVEGLKETFRLIYRSNLQRTRGMAVERLGETSQSAKDLYYRIAIAAARYRLGYDGILETGFQTAMQHGVCALRELEEDASGYGSQSSREPTAKRARLVKPVVAEPLLLNAFSEDVLRTFETAFLEARGHSDVGFIFEDFLAINHASLCEATRRAARDSALQMPVGPDDAPNYVVFDKAWQFARANLRFVSRCSVRGAESAILHDALEHKMSKVIMPCQSMGPDLIVVVWDDEGTPLVILVQSKSSIHASTPHALRSLEQLYVEKRTSTPPIKEDADATAFETVLAKHNCLVALIVVKPFEGSRQAKVSLNAKGRLVVILDKNSWGNLAPGLEKGIAAMSNAKSS